MPAVLSLSSLALDRLVHRDHVGGFATLDQPGNVRKMRR